ncbi:MAG TPA: succinate dehydrogenase assembly factor 2 [Steroidobacteraceae bacterium]|nr:succinate dehydrogenase assembly factor 2 [Steroidobacteraceae bacterium]
MNAPPGELVWRSRRGVRELDLMLMAWLERCYPEASPAERAHFARFLDLPDPQIAAYLLRDERPADPAFAALVTQLAAARV